VRGALGRIKSQRPFRGAAKCPRGEFPHPRGAAFLSGMPQRRFPPPWSVDDPDMKLGQDCFIVRDANGQALAYRSATSQNPMRLAITREAEERALTMATMIDLFRQIVDRGFNHGDLSVAEEICADILIEHEYLAPNARGADILKGQIT
jgi:hypothetical protein